MISFGNVASSRLFDNETLSIEFMSDIYGLFHCLFTLSLNFQYELKTRDERQSRGSLQMRRGATWLVDVPVRPDFPHLSKALDSTVLLDDDVELAADVGFPYVLLALERDAEEDSVDGRPRLPDPEGNVVLEPHEQVDDAPPLGTSVTTLNHGLCTTTAIFPVAGSLATIEKVCASPESLRKNWQKEIS
mgnify:CR=1 FL=1